MLSFMLSIFSSFFNMSIGCIVNNLGGVGHPVISYFFMNTENTPLAPSPVSTHGCDDQVSANFWPQFMCDVFRPWG